MARQGRWMLDMDNMINVINRMGKCSSRLILLSCAIFSLLPVLSSRTLTERVWFLFRDLKSGTQKSRSLIGLTTLETMRFGLPRAHCKLLWNIDIRYLLPPWPIRQSHHIAGSVSILIVLSNEAIFIMGRLSSWHSAGHHMQYTQARVSPQY